MYKGQDPKIVADAMWSDGKLPRRPSPRVVKTIELEMVKDEKGYTNAQINRLAGYNSDVDPLIARQNPSYHLIKQELENNMRTILRKSDARIQAILDSEDTADETVVKIWNTAHKYKPRDTTKGMKRHHNDVQKTIQLAARARMAKLKAKNDDDTTEDDGSQETVRV